MIDLMDFQHFHFLRPYWFFVGLLLLLTLKSLSQRDDTVAIWRKHMSPEVLQALTVQGSHTKFLSPQRISLILTMFICLVLMGPTWKQQSSPFSENNAALIIALDVSQTMSQDDLQPTRLLRAKQKILELLELRGDTKTALVAYSGSAHTVMPISDDSEMIRHFLDVLDEDIMPKKGKLPESVLPVAKRLFEPTRVPGTLLIIGDGATSATVDAFSQYFQNQSDNKRHQLIVWAIGSEAVGEQQGDIIPMQLSQLRELADQSDGKLVTFTHDKQDINQVQRYIEHSYVIVDDKSRPWLDSGYWLLFIIVAIYLLWFRVGWTLQW